MPWVLPHSSFMLVSRRAIFSHAYNLVLRLSFQNGYRVVLWFREDEQSIKVEDNDINANNNIVKQDVNMTS